MLRELIPDFWPAPFYASHVDTKRLRVESGEMKTDNSKLFPKESDFSKYRTTSKKKVPAESFGSFCNQKKPPPPPSEGEEN